MLFALNYINYRWCLNSTWLFSISVMIITCTTGRLHHNYFKYLNIYYSYDSRCLSVLSTNKIAKGLVLLDGCISNSYNQAAVNKIINGQQLSHVNVKMSPFLFRFSVLQMFNEHGNPKIGQGHEFSSSCTLHVQLYIFSLPLTFNIFLHLCLRRI